MDDISMLIQRVERLRSERSNFDALWQEAAELILPRAAHFRGRNLAQGTERTFRQMDEHGTMALDRGCAAFENLVMPRGARWQALRPAEESMLASQKVMAWFDVLTTRLFVLRNDPDSGFVTQSHEASASLLAFGAQSMWADMRTDMMGNPVGIRYASEHLGEVLIEENFQGQIDTTHREFRMKAGEALRKFGQDAVMRAASLYKAAIDPNRRDDEFDFIHTIGPNDAILAGRLDWRGKALIGRYIACADKVEIMRGGYRTSPRVYSRFEKSTNEVYGRGPGINVLPALRQLQEVRAAWMAAAELAAMPPLITSDDMEDQKIHYGPNAIIFGAIDERGQPRMRSLLEDHVDLQPLAAETDRLYGVIDQAFFNDLFLINQDIKTHVSATEITERNAEKGVLLGPLARTEGEWFSPLLARELDLMDQMGLLDDMPQEVADAGGVMTVRYDNPLNRLMQSDAAAGYFRLVSQVGAVANFYPDVGKKLAALYPIDKVIPALADINGVPMSWRATDEEKQAADAADAQQAQLAQLAQLLPAVGGAARDLSVADAAGQTGAPAA